MTRLTRLQRARPPATTRRGYATAPESEPYFPLGWFLQRPAPRAADVPTRFQSRLANAFLRPVALQVSRRIAEAYINATLNGRAPHLNGNRLAGASAPTASDPLSLYYPGEILLAAPAALRAAVAFLNGSDESDAPFAARPLQLLLGRWRQRLLAESLPMPDVRIESVSDARVDGVRVQWGPAVSQTAEDALRPVPALAPQDRDGLTELLELGPEHYLLRWCTVSWVLERRLFDARGTSEGGSVWEQSVRAIRQGAIVSLDVAVTAAFSVNGVSRAPQDILLTLESGHYSLPGAPDRASSPGELSRRFPQWSVETNTVTPSWRLGDLQLLVHAHQRAAE